MMNKFFKPMVIFVLVVCASGVMPGGAVAAGKKRLGILFWDEQGRYHTANNSMLAWLKDHGFPESDLELKVVNAMGNKAKAMKLSQDLAAEKMDIYVALGTSALDAMKTEIMEAPIVFGLALDPVGGKFVKSMKSSENNITGVAWAVSMATIVNKMKAIVPVKTLGVFYTVGQKNSESAFKYLQAIQAECGITVLPLPVNTKEDLVSVLPYLKEKVDAVFITGSTVAASMVPEIVAATAREKIASACIVADYVEKGVLFGWGVNVEEQGQKMGERVEAVLKGADPADLPIGTPEKFEFYVNTKTAAASGIVISEALKKEAAEVVDK